MRSNALFFIFVLLLSLAGFSYSDNQNYGADKNQSNTLSPIDVEFHPTAPLGFFFRLGDDFTFRRYGDYLSLSTLPSLAFSVMTYWMVSKTTASVLSRWTKKPLALHTAQVLSMAIFPGVKSALYSWYTGTRLGSEQIQVDPPHIRRRFYLELIYQQKNHQQMLRITPFPLNPSMVETALSGGYSPWLELYEASSQHSVVHIDLSWVAPESPEAIRIDIHYSDKPAESRLVTLTQSSDSDSLPVSIESLLHNEANDEASDFANGHAIASLLSDAIINHTQTLIQNPDSAPTSFPVSEVAGKVEFTADGRSGQLSLCGEQQPDCDSHLQLTYKLFPYPHFGMTLQGQHDIKTNVDATLAQLANANRAELLLQLLEKATLHFFMASVQQKQEKVSPETALVPSPHKPVVALQPETLMPASPLLDSVKRPMQWLDNHQMPDQKSAVVKIESVQSPVTFQEDDLLLIYPDYSSNLPGFDLNVNPRKLKDALIEYVHDRLVFLYERNNRDDLPTWDEEKLLADSILMKLPTALYQFLNKDWSGRDKLAPEEYQALVKFHCAFVFFDEKDYRNYEIFQERGWKYVPYVESEMGDEFDNFLTKECLPLRKGWSQDELEIIENWLNFELKNCQDYPNSDEMSNHVKLCHYGSLKVDCVSVCSGCFFMFENRGAYNRIKYLESQLKKLP
ncbi:hypothetical protein [Endozoicomonas sp. 4G]|uniref:hypothetical protein n=1 Tax=Endozoicomonas sp. 4G TaxID=2872754 RepID=UPI0020790E12|nr:hypothetical protein [Endozoicomonas sp. 4G]